MVHPAVATCGTGMAEVRIPHLAAVVPVRDGQFARRSAGQDARHGGCIRKRSKGRMTMTMTSKFSKVSLDARILGIGAGLMLALLVSSFAA